MGVHTGHADTHFDDHSMTRFYYGDTATTSAQLASRAHEGVVLVSRKSYLAALETGASAGRGAGRPLDLSAEAAVELVENALLDDSGNGMGADRSGYAVVPRSLARRLLSHRGPQTVRPPTKVCDDWILGAAVGK